MDLEYVERRAGFVSDIRRQLDCLVHSDVQNLGIVGREGDGGEIGPGDEVHQSQHEDSSNADHVVAVTLVSRSWHSFKE